MVLGFPHPAGGIDPGDLRFRPRVVVDVEIWKNFLSGDETLSSPGVAGPRCCPERQLSPRAGSMSSSQSATSQWGLGFHTVRIGIDAGDLRFRPRVVVVVEIWKNFLSEDETLSFPGVAGPRSCPEGKLSPRAGSTSLKPISSQPVGFTLRGGIDPGDLRFRPRVVGVVDVWNGF